MSSDTPTARTRLPLVKPPVWRSSWRRRDPQPATPPDPKRDDLRRSVGVDGHLARVHDLLAEYRLTRRRQPELYALLDQIQEHEREHRLFLGVVGEFSSGKSTLLNALLRDDLLKTDIIQGTTAAATVLAYGPELAVAIVRRRHPVVRALLAVWAAVTLPARLLVGRSPRDRDGLRDLIHTHSAVEEVARRVAQVNVAHPAECLRSGLVIVDLPGTNADNPRHGGVTAAALAEFCDAALVVVPADAPGVGNPVAVPEVSHRPGCPPAVRVRAQQDRPHPPPPRPRAVGRQPAGPAAAGPRDRRPAGCRRRPRAGARSGGGAAPGRPRVRPDRRRAWPPGRRVPAGGGCAVGDPAGAEGAAAGRAAGPAARAGVRHPDPGPDGAARRVPRAPRGPREGGSPSCPTWGSSSPGLATPAAVPSGLPPMRR